AARRAEERVPLDAVLTAYHVGARIGWQALVDNATEDETDAVIAAGGRVLSYTQQVVAEVAAAYLEEQQTIYGEERDARRALASLARLPQLADSVAVAAGATVLAGGAMATGATDITRAAAQAQDVVRLARALARPPGGYQLRDVLLEYQLTRPSDAQGVLAA